MDSEKKLEILQTNSEKDLLDLGSSPTNSYFSEVMSGIVNSELVHIKKNLDYVNEMEDRIMEQVKTSKYVPIQDMVSILKALQSSVKNSSDLVKSSNIRDYVENFNLNFNTNTVNQTYEFTSIPKESREKIRKLVSLLGVFEEIEQE